MQVNSVSHPVLPDAPNPNFNEEAANTRNEEHAASTRKLGDGAMLVAEPNPHELASRFAQEVQKRFRMANRRVSDVEDCEVNHGNFEAERSEDKKACKEKGFLEALQKRFEDKFPFFSADD